MPLLMCFHCLITEKVQVGLYGYLTAGILTELFYKCLLSSPPPSIKKVVQIPRFHLLPWQLKV